MNPDNSPQSLKPKSKFELCITIYSVAFGS